MIVLFEISAPFRAKPKLERFSFGWRIIWLWFSFAVWPPLSINTMRKAWLAERGVKR